MLQAWARTNPASGQGGTWTWELRIVIPVLRPLANLPFQVGTAVLLFLWCSSIIFLGNSDWWMYLTICATEWNFTAQGLGPNFLILKEVWPEVSSLWLKMLRCDRILTAMRSVFCPIHSHASLATWYWIFPHCTGISLTVRRGKKENCI